MIKLSRCKDADQAGEYFRLQLQGDDTPTGTFSPAPSSLDARWVGSALALLSLSPLTTPSCDHLVRLARGLHPWDGSRLAPTINRTRCFYELICSAPKTISMAALLLPDHPTARKVAKAHLLAARCLAQDVGRWMIRGQFLSSPLAAGWLGMLCGHTHSRMGDPHLHHHLVVPNMMFSQKKEWRALQVDLTDTNRLRLGLLYGHTLARELRREGLGAELEMQAGGLPELRSLLPWARTFCQAREHILQAAEDAEAKRAANPDEAGADDGAEASEILPPYPAHPRRAALRRRQHLADINRPEKPPHADDPTALGSEARRWRGQLPKEGLRALQQMLDRAVDAPGKEFEGAVPPLDKAFFRGLCRRLPEGRLPTGPVLMQAAVCASAGRHTWEALRAASREYFEESKKTRQKVLSEFRDRAERRTQAKLAGATPQVPTTATPPPPPPPSPLSSPSPSPRRASGRRR